MATILIGKEANFSVTLAKDGKAVAIPSNAVVNVQIFTADGKTALFNAFQTPSTHPLADWSNGVIGIRVEDSVTQSLPIPAISLLVYTGGTSKRFRANTESLTAPTRSALFIKDIAVDELRADALVLMGQSFFPDVALSDDYLWNKLLAAESQIAGASMLNVPLEPTAYFPSQPTQAEIDALNGMPYEIDPGYDYEPEFWSYDNFGFVVTRRKPIISISSVKIVYPTNNDVVYDFPVEWIKFDSKYGHIRIVPNGTTYTASTGIYAFQAAGARRIPFGIELRYVAGLKDAGKLYPELIDVIKRMAALKIIEDGFSPASGSISADGLSESMSVDMQRYRDSIDAVINGPKGSNGGLMVAIHGIRHTVMGH